jgi:hypothetical protein
MIHLVTTLLGIFVILGGLIATTLGWKACGGLRSDLTGPRWRWIATLLSLVLVTLSIIVLVAYMAHNALTGGDRNGSSTILTFIRTGNYLSLLGALVSLAGKGKARWLALIGGCVMLFIWFSKGMSL